MSVLRKVALSIGFFAALVPAAAPAAPTQLLNVSYDPTRELYQEINAAFEKRWSAQTKQQITIRQSHGVARDLGLARLDGFPAGLRVLGLRYHVCACLHNESLDREPRYMPSAPTAS